MNTMIRQKTLYSIIKRRLEKRKDLNLKGGFCVFIKLNDRWGVKLYNTKEKRDECFVLQLRASRKKVAPKVGFKVRESFIFSRYNRESEYWGFLTEVADLPFNTLYNKKAQKVSRILQSRMFKRGFDTDDLHAYNIGKIGERYVCIDFDNAYEIDPKIDKISRNYYGND